MTGCLREGAPQHCAGGLRVTLNDGAAIILLGRAMGTILQSTVADQSAESGGIDWAHACLASYVEAT